MSNRLVVHHKKLRVKFHDDIERNDLNNLEVHGIDGYSGSKKACARACKLMAFNAPKTIAVLKQY
ncbi:hypothetical protein [Bacillus safensis]|uniref:hypothetical protein n=1 Tax=Bacillus safensis TaxID=561879 RepID=UPI003981CB8C